MLFYYFYFIIKNAEHFYAFHDILKSVFTRIQGEADYEKTQNLMGNFKTYTGRSYSFRFCPLPPGRCRRYPACRTGYPPLW